jgi:hypothetical protein
MSSHEAAQAALNVIYNPIVKRALAIQEIFGGLADDDIIALAQWRKANPEAWSKLRAGKAAVVPLHERFGPMLVKDGRMDKPGEPGGGSSGEYVITLPAGTEGHVPAVPLSVALEDLRSMESAPRDGTPILLVVRTESLGPRFVLGRRSAEPTDTHPWRFLDFVNESEGCPACGSSKDVVPLDGFRENARGVLGWLPWPVVADRRPAFEEKG